MKSGKMRNLFRLTLAFAGLSFGISCPAAVDTRGMPPFSLHNVYGDHMVLQRGKPLRFSGTSVPLGEVTVDFHGVVRKAEADACGEWVVELPAEEAGGPYELKVSPPWNAPIPLVLRDIYVGEVWVCSGQSNMEMPVWGDGEHYRLPNGREVARAANDPGIRLFKVPRAMSPDGPCRAVSAVAAWKVATTPQAVEPFSSTAWYFGQNLRRELGPDVAIGLVDASWGGSRIEPWIPRSQFERDGDRGILDRLDLYSVEKRQGADWTDRVAEMRRLEWKALDAWLARFNAYDPARSREAVENWSRADYDDSGWTRLPRNEMTGLAQPGVVWYRFAFDVPAEQADRPLTFRIGFVNDADETYLDGRLIGRTQPHDVENYWAAPRAYAFKAAAGRHVLAIRAMDHNGPGYIGGDVRVADAEGGTLVDLSAQEWVEKIEFRVDPRRLEQRPPLTAGDINPRHNYVFPTGLWNAMVAPVSAFNVRGVIWYQGCSNAAESNYTVRERQLFEGWRTAFRDAGLPFLVTQLSALEQHIPAERGPADFWRRQKPTDNLTFVALRAQQDEMSAYPHTGLACTIDIGDAFDIHPKNKAEVGRRLCHEAMRVAYGRAERLPGPRFASLTREGAALVVAVKDAGNGLVATGGKVNPHLFALAGADGVWHWAEGELRGGDKLVVTSADVSEPVGVRWCWNGYPPDVNVHRADDGLPLFPFEASFGAGK